MYLQIGNKIIHTANMTDAEVTSHEGTQIIRIRFVGQAQREVRLAGKDAEAFLQALPVYTPAQESV